MTNEFVRPDWTPRVRPGSRVLVVGASGGLGGAVVKMLHGGPECVIGTHGATKSLSPADRLIALQSPLHNEEDCTRLVESFCTQAGGIDALVMLAGAIHFSGHWMDMPAEDWERDVDLNLNFSFYLARAAMRRMNAQGSGGRIVLNGTESALHGGSTTSFPYAVAKRGLEALVQGLAREGAAQGILVNGVRLGCIRSGFHERWHERTEAQMQERISLIPLKRAGHPDEAAALIVYLLSDWAGFITGQMLPLTGGDWL
jgi:3-oxoacyl-[acyl-carrier protein] reductase